MNTPDLPTLKSCIIQAINDGDLSYTWLVDSPHEDWKDNLLSMTEEQLLNEACYYEHLFEHAP